MKTKAFTFIEVLIVLVLIGFVAAVGTAVAFPLVQKMKENSLVKAYERGERLNQNDMEIVRRYYKRIKTEPAAKAITRGMLMPASEVMEIVIDGEKYYVWKPNQ